MSGNTKRKYRNQKRRWREDALMNLVNLIDLLGIEIRPPGKIRYPGGRAYHYIRKWDRK